MTSHTITPDAPGASVSPNVRASDVDSQRASQAFHTANDGGLQPDIPVSSSVSQSTPVSLADEKTTGAMAPGDPDLAPPPLPYNLREHKLTITLFWLLIFTECTLIPIIFYFAISRLTDMRPGAMFAIITAMFGFISGGEYGLRGLRLAWKGSDYRPLKGGRRWHFDSTHLILGKPYFVMTALMIGFSIPEPPKIRGLSIIMPVGIIMVIVYMMYTGIAYHFQWPLKWHRLSSHVVGEVTPPLTFCIMEDITGCDGGGGSAYRKAALARFNASPRFRRMLVQMLWGWCITGLLVNIPLIVLAWIIDEEVAYALGWTVPSVWGIIGAFITIKWGQRCLRIEKEKWVQDRTEATAAG